MDGAEPISWADGGSIAVPSSLYARGGTRASDVSGALLGSALLSLPDIVIAVLLRITHGPGVIYRQQRVGRYADPFVMVKFTTMRRGCRRQGASPDGRERRRTRKSPRIVGA